MVGYPSLHVLQGDVHGIQLPFCNDSPLSHVIHLLGLVWEQVIQPGLHTAATTVPSGF